MIVARDDESRAEGRHSQLDSGICTVLENS